MRASFSQTHDQIVQVLNLKRSGSEWKGPCPCCGGTDRFFIKSGFGDDLIAHCRQCGQKGANHHLYKRLADLDLLPKREWIQPNQRVEIDKRIPHEAVTQTLALYSIILNAFDLQISLDLTFEEAWTVHQTEELSEDDAIRIVVDAVKLLEAARKYGTRDPDRTWAWEHARIREQGLIREHNGD